MSWVSILDRIRGCRKGVAAVEFALILMPLSIFMIGSFEVGYRLFAIAETHGALREAARMASTGEYEGNEIDNKVKESLKRMYSTAAVGIDKKSYSDFTGVGLPEPIVSGSIESGTYCFTDVNGTGAWEDDQGRQGLGGPEDVIYYEVTMTYPTLFKFSQTVFGLAPTTTISMNTIVSNEPFAAVVNSPPPKICK